ncbi:unnamed protein product [Cylindrotheca closterium]|uniref:Uncharacterized protein n=1 Tax=Cylindrotheca closterium TaxID=2856 RepID=A0AAD2CWV9_9STRA|nr:unnamed protein product [Cylindrotheca closterium]
MLPHYQYEHYYDQLCECCENEMVSQDERLEEGGECKKCHKTMCEDCREGELCDECEETICDNCAGSCEFCPNVKFCEDCLGEHKQGCSRLTRAERKLEKLNESVESKKWEQADLKRRLKEISQELDDANEEKANAELKLKKLRQRAH